jgi:hypothetical protein
MVDTAEGIDTLSSLIYYSRIRTAYNLLPLLQNSPTPRIISILGGGNERPLSPTALNPRQNYSVMKTMSTGLTKTTLVFEKLAGTHPAVTFIHAHPGLVNTGQIERIFASMTGWWGVLGWVLRWTVVPFVNLFSRRVSEAGEWGVYLATSARYPASQPGEDGGVAMSEGIMAARGSNGGDNGVYRIDRMGEGVRNKFDGGLEKMREEQLGDRIWDDTVAVWSRALESDQGIHQL